MKKLVFMLSVCLLGSAIVSARSKKFIWSDEICTFEGIYARSRYTEKQLENTYQLWYSRDFVLDGDRVFIYNSGLPERRTAASLDEEFARKSTALKNLEIVNTPFWKAFKQKKLKTLEQDYRLARATVRAFQEPAALQEVKFAEGCVKKFAPPLTAGGAVLLEFRRALAEEKRRKSDDPEAGRIFFEERRASTDRFKSALEEILISDWWDCASAGIDRADETKPSKNFRRLFKHVTTLGCDYA